MAFRMHFGQHKLGVRGAPSARRLVQIRVPHRDHVEAGMSSDAARILEPLLGSPQQPFQHDGNQGLRPPQLGQDDEMRKPGTETVTPSLVGRCLRADLQSCRRNKLSATE